MAIPLTARAPVEFTPPTLAKRIAAENVERAKKGEAERERVRIMVRVPTMYERDSFASALVRGGVVNYSKKQIRDLMLAGVTHLMDEDRFDDIRTGLEELWQSGDAQQECRAKRLDRYIELQEQQQTLRKAKRLTDEMIEVELQKIQPSVVISEQQRVKITAIQQDITSRYEPLQMAFADLAEQDIRRAWLCVEIYVINWHGLEHTPEGNGRGGITRLEAEWLRNEIGGEAFDELGGFIFALHSIDGDEEKNLASLIESSSAPTGSPALESMSPTEASAGNSMDESSIGTPATASRKTTARSAGSTKPAAKKTGRSNPSPTVAP